MDSFDPPSPSGPAPPAYEFSQQEYDRKVALAQERSLHTLQEDGFEEWDEDVFQRNAAAVASLPASSAPLPPRPSEKGSYYNNSYNNSYNVSNGGYSSAGQSSSSAPLPPLNIPNRPAYQKQRPSWLDTDVSPAGPRVPAAPRSPGSSSATASPTDDPLPPFSSHAAAAPVVTSPPLPAISRVSQASPEPLPAFTATAQVYDAPPQPPIISPPRSRASTASSHHTAVPTLQTAPAPPLPQVSSPQSAQLFHPQSSHHHSMPPAPRRNATSPAPPRPSTAHQHRQAYHPQHPPPLRVNPADAYGVNNHHQTIFGQKPAEQQRAPAEGAAAFYNAAVASHLRALPSRPAVSSSQSLYGESTSPTDYSSPQDSQGFNNPNQPTFFGQQQPQYPQQQQQQFQQQQFQPQQQQQQQQYPPQQQQQQQYQPQQQQYQPQQPQQPQFGRPPQPPPPSQFGGQGGVMSPPPGAQRPQFPAGGYGQGPRPPLPPPPPQAPYGQPQYGPPAGQYGYGMAPQQMATQQAGMYAGQGGWNPYGR